MKKLSFIFALIALVCFVPYSTVGATKVFQVDTGGTLTTSLLSYYKDEGDSTDFYGSANGTDTSITYSSWNGKVTQGAGFGGSSKIDLGSNFSFERTDSFSVAFWLKTTATGDNAVIGRGTSVLAHTGKGWFIHQVSGGLYLTLNSG